MLRENKLFLILSTFSLSDNNEKMSIPFYKVFALKTLIFFCDEKGRWLNKETYSQRLRRMCKRMGYEITNNHAFRMSLNSNVFIHLGLPVTQRARLLGHSVEVNERKYSHSRTESLVDIKEILDRSIHARSRNMPA